MRNLNSEILSGEEAAVARIRQIKEVKIDDWENVNVSSAHAGGPYHAPHHASRNAVLCIDDWRHLVTANKTYHAHTINALYRNGKTKWK